MSSMRQKGLCCGSSVRPFAAALRMSGVLVPMRAEKCYLRQARVWVFRSRFSEVQNHHGPTSPPPSSCFLSVFLAWEQRHQTGHRHAVADRAHYPMR